MARCGCAGSSCSCLVVGGAGVSVDGVGSTDRPYVISTAPVYADLVIETGNYSVGSDQPMGTRTVISLDFLETSGMILLPDGSGGIPAPPAGSELEMFVNGPPGGDYQFGGAALNWAGGEPTTETRGWYRFTLMWSDIWLAEYVGLV